MAVMQIAAILLVAVAPWLPESSTLEEHRTPDKLLPTVTLTKRNSREKRAALVMNQPIRILPFFDGDLDSNLGSKASLVRNTIIPDLLNFLSQSMSVAPVTGPILINNNCTGGRFFLDQGEMYCVGQCLPTQCGPFSVPTEHLKQCLQCNNPSSLIPANCGTGTPSQDGAGVTGYDFILYVVADQSACPVTSSAGAQVVAFASSCQNEDLQDRPVAGVVNFCPDGLQSRSEDFAFALTKHEILHALVFARNLFALWRNSDNEPRTPRSASTNLPELDSSGGYVISTSTIRPVTYTDWVTFTGPISHPVHQLITPAIRREARQHFGCGTLDGVELENQGGPGTAINHFEKRVLGNEAMTGQLTFNPVFSRFTFAAMEDSGWYNVNYSMAQPLVWGRGAGCRFAQGSCGEWIASRTSSNEPLTPFCNELFSPSARLGCTIDREAVSKCDLVNFSANLEAQYRYFSNAREGGQIQIADFCGIQDVFRITESDGRTRETVCSATSNLPSPNALLESYGKGSRCVNHGRQWTAGSQFITRYGSGCYQYSCTNTSVTITIAGSGIICSCSQANQEMSFIRSVSGVRYTGSIVCPPCEVICEVASSKVVNTGGNSEGGNSMNGAKDGTAAILLIVTFALLTRLVLS